MIERLRLLAATLTTLMAIPAIALAIDVKITRKMAEIEALSTARSEQMEVSFSDGAAVLVGSASQAQIRSSEGSLTGLDLISGTFEIVTAPDGLVSLTVDQCAVDVLSGSLRVNVQSDQVDFVLQTGNGALIRKGAQISHITRPGFSVTTSCADDSTIGAPKEPSAEMLAKLHQDLGPTQKLALLTPSEPVKTQGPTPITNVNYKAPNPPLNLVPSVSPSTDDLTPTVFRLPVSISPSFPTDIGGDVEPLDPCCNGFPFFWNEIERTDPTTPGPTTAIPKEPTDLAVFTPSLIATSFNASTIYQGGAKELTDEIRFAIDPLARTARVLDIQPPETIAVPPDLTIDTREAVNGTLIRLPVSNPAETYVTFTYQGARYALLTGTHSATGDLIADRGDNSFPIGSYETFRLTPGTTQAMSGLVNGLAIDQNAGTYVTLASSNFQITPTVSTSSVSPGSFEIGIGAKLDLSADNTTLASIDLFGSARDDSSHYFDLAAQNGGGISIALASGERVPGLNVPASVQKYGSYLDWGILRGTITTAGNTVDLMPAPWVAGREWSIQDLDGFNGTAVYQGHVLGNAVDSSGARTRFGSYDNSWDFQTGTGTVQVDFDGTSYSGQTARVAGSVGFTGDLAGGNRTGDLTGKFYGNSVAGVAPDAVGGAFTIRGSDTDQYGAEGIFAGQKQ